MMTCSTVGTPRSPRTRVRDDRICLVMLGSEATMRAYTSISGGRQLTTVYLGCESPGSESRLFRKVNPQAETRRLLVGH